MIIDRKIKVFLNIDCFTSLNEANILREENTKINLLTDFVCCSLSVHLQTEQSKDTYPSYLSNNYIGFSKQSSGYSIFNHHVITFPVNIANVVTHNAAL